MPRGREHATQIAARLGDVARGDGLALDGVGVEQGIAAPAFEHCSKLPGEVDGVLMPVFMPNPPVGDITCAASPAMKARPPR